MHIETHVYFSDNSQSRRALFKYFIQTSWAHTERYGYINLCFSSLCFNLKTGLTLPMPTVCHCLVTDVLLFIINLVINQLTYPKQLYGNPVTENQLTCD